MNQIYHWIGAVVFWGIIASFAIWGWVELLEAKWFRPTERRLANGKLLLKILFGYRFPMSKRVTEIAPRFGTNADWWERATICFCIRHARKHGYTEPK